MLTIGSFTRDALDWKIAVDDIEGSLHNMLDPKPNSLHVMGTDGLVAFRALWSNDSINQLRNALRAVTEGARPKERKANSLAMLRGVGAMKEMLGLSGRQAKRDVMTQAPPVYAMAWTSGLFRPLPYLGRSLMGTTVMMAFLAAVIGLVFWPL